MHQRVRLFGLRESSGDACFLKCMEISKLRSTHLTGVRDGLSQLLHHRAVSVVRGNDQPPASRLLGRSFGPSPPGPVLHVPHLELSEHRDRLGVMPGVALDT